MNAMKAAGGYAIPNAAGTQTKLTHLVEADNPVLLGRERRNCLVQRGRGELRPVYARDSPHPRRVAQCELRVSDACDDCVTRGALGRTSGSARGIRRGGPPGAR